MIAKIFKYLAIGIAGALVLALSVALGCRAWWQHSVAARRAIRSPHGIQILEPVRIGGIDQWIEARGQNSGNPILLFVHGGPGVAFMPLAGSFEDPWERYFTVVQWDQRGAGKTYGGNDKEVQRRTINLAQMEQDAFDVTNYLRTRFHKQKIFILGHSWGSILGLWMAHEHPELIYAYVGVGQVIDSQRNEEVAYQDALREARLGNRKRAIQALEALAPFPGPNPDFQKTSIARGWEEFVLGRPQGPAEFLNLRRLFFDLVSAPEYTLADDYNFIRGRTESFNLLLPELAQANVNRLGPRFRTPVFFFQGRLDAPCRPSLVEEYAKSIEAPHKEFVLFENAGHFPFFEEAANFTNQLVLRVLPFAR